MEAKVALPQNLHLQRHLHIDCTQHLGDSYRHIQQPLVRVLVNTRRRSSTSRSSKLPPSPPVHLHRRSRNAPKRCWVRNGDLGRHRNLTAAFRLPHLKYQTGHRQIMANILVLLSSGLYPSATPRDCPFKNASSSRERWDLGVACPLHCALHPSHRKDVCFTRYNYLGQ